jgi:hypothetical protein
MRFKGNENAPQLRDLVLSVNQTTFHQLQGRTRERERERNTNEGVHINKFLLFQDESMEILLPVVIKLLYDPSTHVLDVSSLWKMLSLIFVLL